MSSLLLTFEPPNTDFTEYIVASDLYKNGSPTASLASLKDTIQTVTVNASADPTDLAVAVDASTDLTDVTKSINLVDGTES
jgi:hypothetical protein